MALRRLGALGRELERRRARRDAGPGSDVDVLVEIVEPRSLLELAGLQGDLEDLLGCPVHVVTTRGLRQAREHARDQIEREAVLLWASAAQISTRKAAGWPPAIDHARGP